MYGCRSLVIVSCYQDVVQSGCLPLQFPCPDNLHNCCKSLEEIGIELDTP